MTKYYPVPVYWSLRANLSNKINTYNLGQLCFNTKQINPILTVFTKKNKQ